MAKVKSAGESTLPGTEAFALHDTYGFPIEITLEMAADQGVAVDEDGFRRLMSEQKERAKADARARKAGLTPATVYREVMDASGITDFTGYTEVTSRGDPARAARRRPVGGCGRPGHPCRGRPGPHAVLRRGRRPDRRPGPDRLAGGTILEVYDVQQPVPGLFVHRASVVDGMAEVGAARDRGGRHPAPAGDLAGPHRHAHDPQGLPGDPGRHRHPDGFGELPGSVCASTSRTPLPCRPR